ncbi:MAG: hypothetical protein KME54_25080 [Tolypothrix brevis GSE-NOS-MK-07-07A]|nr:hypothetical protein [Tolypothrix brevis GSE-NOS-MK-07-07A]
MAQALRVRHRLGFPLRIKGTKCDRSWVSSLELEVRLGFPRLNEGAIALGLNFQRK